MINPSSHCEAQIIEQELGSEQVAEADCGKERLRRILDTWNNTGQALRYS